MERQRVLYLSSKDQINPAGSKSDFCVDISPLLFDMNSERDNVTVSASVGQVYIPFVKDSRGFPPRNPSVSPIPQVKLLRLHTDLPHHNMSSNQHTSAVLQIPFMEHYTEAIDSTDTGTGDSFSHVSFEEKGDQYAKFDIFHGNQGISCLRFWISDEQDRLIVPADDWHVALNLTYKLDQKPEERSFRILLLNRLDNLIELNRLLLLQGDTRLSLNAFSQDDGKAS